MRSQLPVGLLFLALSSPVFGDYAIRDGGITRTSVAIARRAVIERLQLDEKGAGVSAPRLVREQPSRGRREYIFTFQVCRLAPCDGDNSFEVLVHEKSRVVPFDPAASRNEFLRAENVSVYVNSASAERAFR